MFAVSLRAEQNHRLIGRLVLTQRESGHRASWSGTVSASEPIVAMCFLLHGDQLQWTRSPTCVATELSVGLFLATENEVGSSNLYVTWSVGGCQTQICVECPKIAELPNRVEREIVLGESFYLADAAPSVSLFGLVLPKGQVKSKRNRRWALKDEYLIGLPAVWRDIMVRGRTGTVTYGD